MYYILLSLGVCQRRRELVYVQGKMDVVFFNGGRDLVYVKGKGT